MGKSPALADGVRIKLVGVEPIRRDRCDLSFLDHGLVIADVGFPQDFEELERLHSPTVIEVEVDRGIVEESDR